jgi:hypothetical protein
LLELEAGIGRGGSDRSRIRDHGGLASGRESRISLTSSASARERRELAALLVARHHPEAEGPLERAFSLQAPARVKENLRKQQIERGNHTHAIGADLPSADESRLRDCSTRSLVG